MGNVVQYSRLIQQNQQGFMKPLIFCDCKEVDEASAYGINQKLSEQLIKTKPERRSMKLEMCFNQVLAELPDDVIIKEFDVMFHPDYKVDVLQVLIAAYRKKPFSVIWHGKLIGEKLIYAEDGYADYKEFSVMDYDITCVI